MSVETLLTALIAAAFLSSVPIMLAAVGESISEGAGLLNLGIEGTMLAGAFGAFWISLKTDSAPAGLLLGTMIGAVIGVGFGVMTTIGKADQVVLGLGITLSGAGGTAFLFRETWGSDQPLLSHGLGRPLGGSLNWIPVVGPAIGQQRWFVFVAWVLVIAAHFFLFRTRLGTSIRAAGESPFALEAVGGDVVKVRIMAAIIGGAFSGLAGASLVTVELGFFSPGVTLGAGFLAIALAMLGRLSPIRVALMALLFGLLTGLDTGLQIAGVDARPEFLQMLPYIGIVIALVLFGRHARMPGALGQPYGGITTRQ